nr:hypothetical protein [Micromonospora sp. DSM 115978]
MITVICAYSDDQATAYLLRTGRREGPDMLVARHPADLLALRGQRYRVVALSGWAQRRNAAAIEEALRRYAGVRPARRRRVPA